MRMPPYLRVKHYPLGMIDAIDPTSHPSLKGYWKCNDGVSTVRDYSQYGNHLTVELSGVGFTAKTMWSTKPGWMCIKNHDRARIALTPSLSVGDKFIIVACEVENENMLSDCDLGTAWNSAGLSTGEYRGFSVATVFGVLALRTSEYVLGGGIPAHPDLVLTNAAVVEQPILLRPWNVAGVFKPGVSVDLYRDGLPETSEATTTATLEAQENSFALAAARNAGYEDTTGYTAVRNFQLWAFDAEPPRLHDTLRWMSANPGLVPWWWV